MNVKTSESITKIAPALVAFGAEVENCAFDAKNPHFNSKFASLPSMLNYLRPLAAKHGMCILQSARSDTDTDLHGASTMLLHESGEWVESEAVMFKSGLDKKGNHKGPLGSSACVSFARRYSVQCLCGITGEEDDDGVAGYSQAPNKGTEIKDAFAEAEAEMKRKVSATHLAEFSKRLNDLTFVDEPKELFDAITAELGVVREKHELLPTHLAELVEIYNETKKAVEAKGAKK